MVFGSAITGAGVTELLDVVADLGPLVERDLSGPASGVVFKVERDASGSRGVLVRMQRGTLRVRDRVAFAGRRAERVTGLEVYEPGRAVRVDEVRRGTDRRAARRADGADRRPVRRRRGRRAGPTAAAGRRCAFTRPSLETVVVPDDPTRAGALFTALTELADQDPLIDLRHDDGRRETSLTLYGEVQKEVIAAVLSSEYGVAVTFRPTTRDLRRAGAGTGSAVELIGRHPNAVPRHRGPARRARAGRRRDEFALEVELGSMPPAFFTAVRGERPRDPGRGPARLGGPRRRRRR